MRLGREASGQVLHLRGSGAGSRNHDHTHPRLLRKRGRLTGKGKKPKHILRGTRERR